MCGASPVAAPTGAARVSFSEGGVYRRRCVQTGQQDSAVKIIQTQVTWRNHKRLSLRDSPSQRLRDALQKAELETGRLWRADGASGEAGWVSELRLCSA